MVAQGWRTEGGDTKAGRDVEKVKTEDARCARSRAVCTKIRRYEDATMRRYGGAKVRRYDN